MNQWLRALFTTYLLQTPRCIGLCRTAFSWFPSHLSGPYISIHDSLFSFHYYWSHLPSLNPGLLIFSCHILSLSKLNSVLGFNYYLKTNTPEGYSRSQDIHSNLKFLTIYKKIPWGSVSTSYFLSTFQPTFPKPINGRTMLSTHHFSLKLQPLLTQHLAFTCAPLCAAHARWSEESTRGSWR